MHVYLWQYFPFLFVNFIPTFQGQSNQFFSSHWKFYYIVFRKFIEWAFFFFLFHLINFLFFLIFSNKLSFSLSLPSAIEFIIAFYKRNNEFQLEKNYKIKRDRWTFNDIINIIYSYMRKNGMLIVSISTENMHWLPVSIKDYLYNQI